jgi:hypothetical protein
MKVEREGERVRASKGAGQQREDVQEGEGRVCQLRERERKTAIVWGAVLKMGLLIWHSWAGQSRSKSLCNGGAKLRRVNG